MYCGKCGAQIADNARFCTKCGAPLEDMTVAPEISKPEKVKKEKTAKVKKEKPIQDVQKAESVAMAQDKANGSAKKILKTLGIVCLIGLIIGLLTIGGYIAYTVFFDKSDQNEYEELYRKAQKAAQEGEYEDAIRCYKRLIKINPDEPELYLEIANAYGEMEEYDKAIDILTEGYKNTEDDDILDLLEDFLEEEGKTLEDIGLAADGSSGKKDDTSKENKSADADEGVIPDSEKKEISIDVRQVDNSNFPAVSVYASIKDGNGEPVEGIKETDFNITEIDKTGVSFDTSVDKLYKVLDKDDISVNLVLDASGSMDGTKLTQTKSAAKSFIDYMDLEGGDRAEIITFDDYVYLLQEFTDDNSALNKAIDDINVGNSTALYDAIYSGVYQTYSEDGAKCVIAFTDGEENASSYTFDDVVEIAQNSGIPVYIIGIGDYSYDASKLSDLAVQCSGKYYSANDSDLEKVLEEIYIEIYKEQQNWYVLNYTSKNEEDLEEFRNIVIDTTGTSQFKGHTEKSYVPESDVSGAFSKDYMNKDYILEFSSNEEVTESDLEDLSLAELRIARNEIYARHGRQFKDPLLNQWFYSKDWYLGLQKKYSPDYFDSHSPDKLNDLELKNANFILEYEKNVMNNRDIYPYAATQLLSDYDLALSKPVLKNALSQMENYSETPTLKENKRLIQEVIDKPDVSY